MKEYSQALRLDLLKEGLSLDNLGESLSIADLHALVSQVFIPTPGRHLHSAVFNKPLIGIQEELALKSNYAILSYLTGGNTPELESTKTGSIEEREEFESITDEDEAILAAIASGEYFSGVQYVAGKTSKVT